MNKKLLLIPFSFFTFFVFAAKEKKVNSKITNAIVYFNKALINRSSDFNLDAGITTLVFENISPKILDKTIQAKSNGNFMIIDVRHDIKYVEPKVIVEEEMPLTIRLKIERLSDSLFLRELDLQRIVAKRTNLEKEKDIILKNKLYQGTGKSDTMPVLKDMMGFYRIKMEEIQNELYKIKLQEYKAEKARSQLKAKLTDLENYNKKVEIPTEEVVPNHCVYVTVSSDQATSGNINISYLVTDAGWEPGYDLRSANSKTNLTMTYKANVFQNTGEDWDNVKLKLSTFSNRDNENVKPNLLTWAINYFVNKPKYSYQLSPNVYSNSNMSMSVETMTSIITSPFQQKVLEMEEARKDELSDLFNDVEFDIKTPFSIPSNGSKVMMSIQNKNVPVNYSFYVVPKLNKNAFLVAKMANWEELNLLPAMSNIYVNDTYMGETTISTDEMDSLLEVSMGKDEDIISSRKKIKDVDDGNGIVAKKKTRTITIELVVKNNKQHEVDLTLEDQIPIPGDKSITVAMVDSGEAEYDKADGSMSWNIRLQAKQSKKIKFTYAVEYDKDKKLD